MSRAVKEPFDVDEWRLGEMVPEWMTDDTARPGAKQTPLPLDPVTREHLISRARYIGEYNRDIDEPRLQNLSVFDEMLSAKDPGVALVLLHETYNEPCLNPDEDFQDPSDDFRVRASLLYAHFLRLKEYRQARRPGSWHSYYDDLLQILRAASIKGDEKQAFAQQLIFDNPLASRAELARLSRAHHDKKFDQSCLSQWLKAGIVLDPYADGRPRFGVGTRRSGVPKTPRALSPDRRGSAQ